MPLLQCDGGQTRNRDLPKIGHGKDCTVGGFQCGTAAARCRASAKYSVLRCMSREKKLCRSRASVCVTVVQFSRGFGWFLYKIGGYGNM